MLAEQSVGTATRRGCRTHGLSSASPSRVGPRHLSSPGERARSDVAAHRGARSAGGLWQWHVMCVLLYETLKRYGQYMTTTAQASKEFDISVLSSVMFRTLALTTELFLDMHNYQGARQAIHDLQTI